MIRQLGTRDVRTSKERSHREGNRYHLLALRIIGAGLLVATGAIHLDLYLTGYKTIPTIGWLFLLQLITAFGLGVAVAISRSRLVSVAGAGFAVATLGGYLLSLRIGLFGFREVRTAAGLVAGLIEVITFAVLTAFVLSPTALHQPVRVRSSHKDVVDKVLKAIPGARWAALAFTVLAAVLLGVSLAATEPTATGVSSSSSLIKVAQIRGNSVLTDSKGFTLYWFAPDTPTKSTCYGTCAEYWPPVTGVPIAGPGVTGTLGTIRRSNGTSQITYDHHPLYTYVGDSAAGQANGNDINLNGGLWYEMSVSG